MPPKPRQKLSFRVAVEVDCDEIARLPGDEAFEFIKGVETAVGDLGFTEEIAKYCIAIIKQETEAGGEVFDINSLLPAETPEES